MRQEPLRSRFDKLNWYMPLLAIEQHVPMPPHSNTLQVIVTRRPTLYLHPTSSLAKHCPRRARSSSSSV